MSAYKLPVVLLRNKKIRFYATLDWLRIFPEIRITIFELLFGNRPWVNTAKILTNWKRGLIIQFEICVAEAR